MKKPTKKIIKNLNPLLRKKKVKTTCQKKSDRARTRDNPLAELLASIFD